MRNFDKIFDRGKRREDDFKRRDGERPKMYKAVCDSCGKKCELPFKPTNDKPVYCSQCFSERGEGRSSREGDRTNRRFQEKRMFSAICDKCGKRFELPFKPTGEREVYCSQCFKGDGNVPSSKNSNQYGDQIEILNKKIDKVIELLTLISEKKPTKKVKLKD
ncbi:MAG: CxxC-x17-CxxC domain-containing protein [Candidatus Paceibacterota bacterium]|jgi:CxxC-x17-CxxC domain-containing protein